MGEVAEDKEARKKEAAIVAAKANARAQRFSKSSSLLETKASHVGRVWDNDFNATRSRSIDGQQIHVYDWYISGAILLCLLILVMSLWNQCNDMCRPYVPPIIDYKARLTPEMEKAFEKVELEQRKSRSGYGDLGEKELWWTGGEKSTQQ